MKTTTTGLSSNWEKWLENMGREGLIDLPSEWQLSAPCGVPWEKVVGFMDLVGQMGWDEME